MGAMCRTMSPRARTSEFVRPMDPRWNIALTMQHKPLIDMVIQHYVKDQIWKTCQRPQAQARQVQFVGVAG